jgi:hypothetical protein
MVQITKALGIAALVVGTAMSSTVEEEKYILNQLFETFGKGQTLGKEQNELDQEMAQLFDLTKEIWNNLKEQLDENFDDQQMNSFLEDIDPQAIFSNLVDNQQEKENLMSISDITDEEHGENDTSEKNVFHDQK